MLQVSLLLLPIVMLHNLVSNLWAAILAAFFLIKKRAILDNLTLISSDHWNKSAHHLLSPDYLATIHHH